VSWMLPWHAASKPSSTLRECSGRCAEPAPQNIGKNASHAIYPSSTELRLNEWTSVHSCSRHAPKLTPLMMRPPLQPRASQASCEYLSKIRPSSAVKDTTPYPQSGLLTEFSRKEN
jgi:hypothetical protein